MSHGWQYWRACRKTEAAAAVIWSLYTAVWRTLIIWMFYCLISWLWKLGLTGVDCKHSQISVWSPVPPPGSDFHHKVVLSPAQNLKNNSSWKWHMHLFFILLDTQEKITLLATTRQIPSESSINSGFYRLRLVQFLTFDWRDYTRNAL